MQSIGVTLCDSRMPAHTAVGTQRPFSPDPLRPARRILRIRGLQRTMVSSLNNRRRSPWSGQPRPQREGNGALGRPPQRREPFYIVTNALVMMIPLFRAGLLMVILGPFMIDLTLPDEVFPPRLTGAITMPGLEGTVRVFKFTES